MTEAGKKTVILAVDDTPENLDVVKGILANDSTAQLAGAHGFEDGPYHAERDESRSRNRPNGRLN
jgi:hypothetical protein